LALAAIDVHKNGRDDEAIEYVYDALAIGDSVATIPSVVTHLRAIDIYSVSCQPLESILSGIKIGQGPGSVTAADLHRLLARLMDTTKFDRALKLAIMSERSEKYDAGRQLMNMELPGEVIGSTSMAGRYLWALRNDANARWAFDFCVAPQWRIDTARAVDFWNRSLELADIRTSPEFKRAAAQARHDCDEHVFPRVLSCYLLPAINREFVLHLIALQKRRMAAVAVAVRLHQTDCGRMPDTLDQLVPKFLAEAPQDLLAEPGTPIRYVNGVDTSLLYSVGENGQDDGGDYEGLAEGVEACKDLPFFLKGRPIIWERESAPDDGED